MTERAMSPAAFEAALGALGLAGDGKTAAAAATLGVTTRCVRRWRQGTRRIVGPVVVLLEVLVAMVS